jgi:hypothetical protein
MYPGVPTKCPSCVKRVSPRLRRGRLGQPEVDDPRHGFAVHFHHQNVCRFQIAMDDGFLVRVLHAFADLDEEFEPIRDLEFLLIAILGNRQSGYVLHHEVRLALRRRSGVKHLGDGGMIHDRQRLPLRLEALHDRLVVHPGLDQLQGDLAPHRRSLFGQPDLAHASFAKLADELKTFGKVRLAPVRIARKLARASSPEASRTSTSCRKD